MWLFVIDTDAYAGNFERELTAWCTGVVGACGGGREHAERCRKDFPQWVAHFHDWLSQESDEHGVARPCTTFPTPGWSNDGYGHVVQNTSLPYPAYQSVAIFFTDRPTDDALCFLIQRARTYLPLLPWATCGTITGFRLLEQVSQYQEHPIKVPVP